MNKQNGTKGTAEHMIMAFHHVALIVSSEKSIGFYKKLGFREIFRKERLYDTVVLMEGYGVQLELFIDARHSLILDNEPLGLRHFALKVDSIEKTLKELDLEEQAYPSIVLDWTGVRFCFINDPDGLIVELHE